MKKSSQPQLSTPARKSNGLVALISVAGIILSMILALIVIIMPVGTPGKNAPTVIFTGDYESFPKRSMKNSMSSVGFNMELAEDKIDVDDEPVVIVAVGEDAFGVVSEYKDNPYVMGFVLVCPEFPEGSKVNGMNASYPDKDIAIFAGVDTATTVGEMSDARLIYERLSGDDTVYGTPIKRGGLFASKVFVNNAQNRWLSLSNFKISSGEKLLFSPLFQNELAGYLATSYGNSKDASFFRINSYFVITALSLMLTFAFFLLYLAGTLIKPEGMKLSSTYYIITGISGFGIAAIVTAGSLIPRIRDFMGKMLPFESVIVLFVSGVVCVIGMIFGKNRMPEGNIPSRKDDQLTRIIKNLMFTVAPVILLLEYVFIIGDMSSDKAGYIVVFAILDALAYAVLYFAEFKYTIITNVIVVISALVMLVIGILSSTGYVVDGAFVALGCTIGAGIVAFPASRHGSNALFAGFAHGMATLLLLFALI